MLNTFHKSFVATLQHEWRMMNEIQGQYKTLNYLRGKYVTPYFDFGTAKFQVKPKKSSSSRVIWQYWGQGLDNAPELVQSCTKSVRENLPCGYDYVFLTDKNVKEWIDLPEFIDQRLQEGNGYSRTFSSDIIRLSLLKAYGGIWVDSTVLLTGRIPERYMESSFFCFYRGARPNDWRMWERFNPMYFSWRRMFKVHMCSSFLIAHPNHPLVTALLDILLSYWKNEQYWRHYFILQLIFEELVSNYFSEEAWSWDSDLLCHQMLINCRSQYDANKWNKIVSSCPIHKLTYYNDCSRTSLFHKIVKDYGRFSFSSDSSL